MTDERILTRCPKCKTRTLKREGKELVCSTCHGRFPEAESPEVASHGHVRHRMTRAQVQERHRYYEDNKEAILTDLKSMGIPATAKKWKIPYATVNTLRRRWGAEDDPRGRNTTWDKHEHYEKHKDEILRDLKLIGRKASKEKWKLPPSTLVTLLTRWGVPLEGRGPDNGGLPPLPPWNDKWDPEVQIKWLDTYGKIYGGAK